MAEKATCPACGTHTSGVYAALIGERKSCPQCGLAGDAMRQLDAARRRGADQALIDQAANAELRASLAESKVREMETRLSAIRGAVEGEYREWGDIT